MVCERGTRPRATGMNIVQTDHVRAWFASGPKLSDFVRSIGRKSVDLQYLEGAVGMPLHLARVVERLSEERGRTISQDALDSIPFYSLCRGLLLPLTGLSPDRVAGLFGIQVDAPPDTAGRGRLLLEFFQKPIGLS